MTQTPNPEGHTMSMINPASPVGFLLLMLDARRHSAREERGASAVEWVIIAAIVVGICIAIAAILRAALVGEAGDIGDQIQNQ
jgi:Flp pilus assembly pilin Flp